MRKPRLRTATRTSSQPGLELRRGSKANPEETRCSDTPGSLRLSPAPLFCSDGDPRVQGGDSGHPMRGPTRWHRGQGPTHRGSVWRSCCPPTPREQSKEPRETPHAQGPKGHEEHSGITASQLRSDVNKQMRLLLTHQRLLRDERCWGGAGEAGRWNGVGASRLGPGWSGCPEPRGGCERGQASGPSALPLGTSREQRPREARSLPSNQMAAPSHPPPPAPTSDNSPMLRH